MKIQTILVEDYIRQYNEIPQEKNDVLRGL